MIGPRVEADNGNCRHVCAKSPHTAADREGMPLRIKKNDRRKTREAGRNVDPRRVATVAYARACRGVPLGEAHAERR